VLPAQRTRSHPVLVLLLLSLQLGVVGLLPIIDGDRELASLSRVTHVESEGRTDCAPVHNHVTCQLCRIAGPKFVSPSVLSAALGGGVLRSFAPAASRSCQSAPAGRFALARAPPLA
jgi:hypothetical protein